MNRVTGAILILWAAFGMRLAYESVYQVDRASLPPVRPLAELPLDVLGEGWVGEDVPLPDRIVKIAAVSDYVYRRYSRGDATLIFYVGYVTDWASGGIHSPEVCFPRQGYMLENQETVPVPVPGLAGGSRFEETLWSNEHSALKHSLYSLHSFFYHGQFAPEEYNLRMADRFPGLRYFAIIILAGNVGNSLDDTRQTYTDILHEAVPRVLKHFPDENATGS